MVWCLGAWIKVRTCPGMVTHSRQLGPGNGAWRPMGWEGKLNSGLWMDWGDMPKRFCMFCLQEMLSNGSQGPSIVHKTQKLYSRVKCFSLLRRGRFKQFDSTIRVLDYWNANELSQYIIQYVVYDIRFLISSLLKRYSIFQLWTWMSASMSTHAYTKIHEYVSVYPYLLKIIL